MTTICKNYTDVSDFMVFSETVNRFMKTGQNYVKLFLDNYKQTTANIDMVEGGLDIEELCSLFGMHDIGGRETSYKYQIIKQTDINGNIYKLFIEYRDGLRENIRMSIKGKNPNMRFFFDLIKETPEHKLFIYINRGWWEPISWEEQYGHTFKQHEILKENTAKASFLRKLLAQGNVTDRYMDELFKKYDALFSLYEKFPCGEMYYECDNLYIIPPYPNMGYAITYTNGKFVLAQYIPGVFICALKHGYTVPIICPAIDKDEEHIVIPRSFYHEVEEVSEEKAYSLFCRFYRNVSEGKNIIIPLKNGRSFAFSYHKDCFIPSDEIAKEQGLSKEDILSVQIVMDYITGKIL